MKTTNVVTISCDIIIDDEKAALVDSIISKYDKAGFEVSASRVLEIALGFCGANILTTLKFMDNKLEKDLEKRCKNESSENTQNQ